MRIPTALRAAAVMAALALLTVASAARAHETTVPERPAPEAAETRLSVVLDASGALSLQLEGPGIPADLAGPWRTDRESLAADIRERLPRAENPQVHFRGSPDASYGMVVDILGVLGKAGYRTRVIIERRRQ